MDVLSKNFEVLSGLFSDIEENKNTSRHIDDKRKQASLLFVAIKKSTRTIKYKIKEDREALQLEKGKLNVRRLHLQNLLYEVNQLKREIIRCYKFKSRDSCIDLLSLEEYDNIATKRKQDRTGSHGEYLNRLESELHLRKQLAIRYKDLVESKEGLNFEILKKSECLSNFAPALRTLIQSTSSLHDALQMSINYEWKLNKVIQMLPRPLYLLYMNIQALPKLKDCVITAEIVGEESEILQRDIEKERQRLKRYISAGSTEGCSKLISIDLEKRCNENGWEPQALFVRISLQFRNFNKGGLLIFLRYFEKLGLVAAHSELSGQVYNGEILFAEDLLKHLYDNDYGNTIPRSDIELKSDCTTSNGFIEYLNKNKYGRCYRWVQDLCAISHHLRVHHVATNLQKVTRRTFGKIINRCRAWTSLTQQIRTLGSKELNLYSLRENVYPSGLSCSLVQWTTITVEEYSGNGSDLAHFIPENDNVLFNYFRAVIVRGSAKMECLIRISSSYPLIEPVWLVCVYWNGRHLATNNSAIKAMECWTNALTENELKDGHGLLFAQLFRTMYSFDIFLETEGSLHSMAEYNKEKPYISAFSKRQRLRPFKFVSSGIISTFKH